MFISMNFTEVIPITFNYILKEYVERKCLLLLGYLAITDKNMGR